MSGRLNGRGVVQVELLLTYEFGPVNEQWGLEELNRRAHSEAKAAAARLVGLGADARLKLTVTKIRDELTVHLEQKESD